MKRPINVQPEVTAYYLEIQMQGGGREGTGGGKEGGVCTGREEEEAGEALILSHKTGHIREQ